MAENAEKRAPLAGNSAKDANQGGRKGKAKDIKSKKDAQAAAERDAASVAGAAVDSAVDNHDTADPTTSSASLAPETLADSAAGLETADSSAAADLESRKSRNAAVKSPAGLETADSSAADSETVDDLSAVSESSKNQSAAAKVAADSETVDGSAADSETTDLEVTDGSAGTTSHSTNSAANRAAKPARKHRPVRTASLDDAMLTAIREQVDNCREELEFSLRGTITEQYRKIVSTALRKADRRRRWSNFFHDFVILIMTAAAVYFGYCLYDVDYFGWRRAQCEKSGTCAQTTAQSSTGSSTQSVTVEDAGGPVKDANWYLTNYRYLFDEIQTQLSPDDLAIYYLYSADWKSEDLPAEYALSMAYNKLSKSEIVTANNSITINGEAMTRAYRKAFGSTGTLSKTDFSHDCYNFKYNKTEDEFRADLSKCTTSRRQIIENIDQIYGEGEVIYIATTAMVYDSSTRSFYNFDDLFRTVVENVAEDDLTLYSARANRYQYQFKKSGESYYLAGAVKLK